MPWLDDVVRAKRPRRLPTVLTPSQVENLFSLLNARIWLACNLMYGSGLRLMTTYMGLRSPADRNLGNR